MTKKRILLVDDDALFLMLTCKLLEKEPYLENIDTLASPDEVKAYFEERKKGQAPFPDAVFIDIDMPEISGLELARQLHTDFLAARPQTKIFILSSSISQRDRQTAEGLEAVTDYMEKPLSVDLLKQALDINDEVKPKDRESAPINKEHQQQTEKVTTGKKE